MMRKFGQGLGKASFLIAPMMLAGAWAGAADAQTGTVKLKVDHLYAYHQTGSRDPSKDKACVDKFKSLEQVVETTYDINPKTLIMSAKSLFNSKTYNMQPLGVASMYAFAYYQKAVGNPPIYAVRFTISKTFTNPTSSIILELDSQTNCGLTSEKAPAAQMKASK